MLKLGGNKYFLGTVYLVLCVVVLIYMNSLFSQNDIVADGGENITMGYNIYQHGIFAMDHDSTGQPLATLYREPVPPFMNAVTMFIHPGIDREASLESFKNGENQNKLKKVNLFWLLLLQIGVGLFIYSLTGNKYIPFLTWFLLLFYFIRFGNHFDEFTTELHGATFIIWVSYVLYLAFKKGSRGWYAAAGVFYGLLILTKSVFFYLLPVIALLLYFVLKIPNKNQKFALLIAGVFLVVGPWLIRNYMLIHEVKLTTRGGLALYDRVLLNQMSEEERTAAVYFWGPELYQDLVKNTSLGIDENEFELGGKFQTLQRAPFIDHYSISQGMPERTVSYTGRMRAEFHRLNNELMHKGKREARLEAHAILKKRSMEWILQNPIQHSAMSVLFFWRGIWCFPNSTIPLINDTVNAYVNEIINILSYLAVFILFFAGIIKRNPNYLALTALPVFMLLFQASITQNVPRFSEQAIPSFLICFTLGIYYLMEWVHQKNLLPGPKFISGQNGKSK